MWEPLDEDRSVKATVAICTWNRASILRDALEAMERLDIPGGVEWELIVVNNNSTDHTNTVVAEFEGKLPVRGLFEPTPGKSYALNRAIDEATGDFILWTDDDAKVDPNWVKAYVEAFLRWPEVALLGGPVKPWFRGKPPGWLVEVLPKVEGAYALRDLGKQPITFTQELLPYGVNMAVRIDEQRRYRYDTSLGPRPDSQVRGEETALIRHMLRDGVQGRWVPGAVVEHFVPEDRQTVSYLRDFYRGLGEVYQLQGGSSARMLFGHPMWLWRELVQKEAHYRFERVFRKPAVWIESLIASSVAWGRMWGSRSGSR